MNQPALWWIVALAGTTLGTWAVLIYWLPKCLCSLFRYRLWQIRDDVQDHVIAGRLPRSKLIKDFIDLVETFIVMSDKFTLVEVLLTPNTQEETERISQEVERGLRQLSDYQQKLFQKYRQRLASVAIKRLFLGSLAGWASLLLLSPVVLCLFAYSLVKRASVSLGDLIVRSVNLVDRKMEKSSLSVPDKITGKVVAMRVVSGRGMSLAKCYV